MDIEITKCDLIKGKEKGWALIRGGRLLERGRLFEEIRYSPNMILYDNTLTLTPFFKIIFKK